MQQFDRRRCVSCRYLPPLSGPIHCALPVRSFAPYAFSRVVHGLPRQKSCSCKLVRFSLALPKRPALHAMHVFLDYNFGTGAVEFPAATCWCAMYDRSVGNTRDTLMTCGISLHCCRFLLLLLRSQCSICTFSEFSVAYWSMCIGATHHTVYNDTMLMTRGGHSQKESAEHAPKEADTGRDCQVVMA